MLFLYPSLLIFLIKGIGFSEYFINSDYELIVIT